MDKWIFFRPTIILISGKAGVGKTTAANELKEYLDSKRFGIFVVKDSFARGVKEVAKKDYGWNGVKDSKGRKLLQDVGKGGREKSKDYWVSYMLNTQNSIFPINVLIVDDWRFPDEAEILMKNYKVIRIHINSPERETLKDTPLYNDESETALDNYTEYEFIIDNKNVNLENYKLMVDTVMEILIQQEMEE